MSKHFVYWEHPGPRSSNHLMCNNCGYEVQIRQDVSYEKQSDCRFCHGRGQMMSWDWEGWKATPERQARLEEEVRKQKTARRRPVSQASEPFNAFTRKERNTHGLLVVDKPGTEAPWEEEFGACVVKVFGIRRRKGRVEFGIGGRRRPIREWVTADRFANEWPQ